MGEKKYSDKGKSGYEIGRAVKLQICRQARLLTWEGETVSEGGKKQTNQKQGQRAGVKKENRAERIVGAGF